MPITTIVLMVAMMLMSFEYHKEIFDQPDAINKDGSISASWVLVGLAGAVVSLLTTMFLFAWRVIQMQGITLNKTNTMLQGTDARMKVLEEICLPSHLNKKGNAEKMAKILRESNKH